MQPESHASQDVLVQGRIDQFQVTLEVFEGPFDLLLQLIARKRLDITQVALAEVTDEFIAHMQLFPDLSVTTEFLVVAATLLDMKAAHLLPRDESVSDVSAQDLEARDVLFSRLLQYRAFRVAAEAIGQRLEAQATSFPRLVPMEDAYAKLLPDLVWACSAHDLARAAADALSHKPPTVEITHLHDPLVPVATQVDILVNKLRGRGPLTFTDLISDAATQAVVVSRFLAVLQLYRAGAVDFTQNEALGRLLVMWTGGEQETYVHIDEEDQ
ncbi:segregation and condensation protein A [Schaalia sp. lx-100]|uniref:segregation and condensation protein A n=1 Tax=Schaalia sp. lx-100 TaxID=2899081 RepID=UPI001E403CC9|nr:ScpA family protein [Schaalia sp. lx-100]MCD4557178.1 segregation/condensation protein A [Schaalia sp. lx-100]